MDLKPFFIDLANNYIKFIEADIGAFPFDNAKLPGGSKKKLKLSPDQQEKFKRDIVEDIYKNKSSMKTTELENILKSKVSPDKIENFHKAVKNKETITKEEFFQLLQNKAL